MAKNTGYTDQDRNINEELYSYFLTHEEDDGWDDRDQHENFRLLFKLSEYSEKPFLNTSVLDVGCGTGDMAQFLRDLGVKKYTGIDIFPPAVMIASEKFPYEKFITGDFLTYKFCMKFDFVLCSGALSTRLSSDNYEMLTSSIKKMWNLSKKGLAFNFLAEETPGEYEDDLFLYNIKRVLKICDELAPGAKFKAKINRTGDRREYLQVHIYLYK